MITILSSLLSRPRTRRKPYTNVVLEISLRIRILVAAYVSAVWSAQHRHISLFTNCMKHASIIDWFMSDLVSYRRERSIVRLDSTNV